MESELQFAREMGPVLLVLVVLLGASALVGRAWQLVVGGGGDDRERLAPLIGLALLVPIASVSLQLSDSTTVSALVVALSVVVSVIVVVVDARRTRRPWRRRGFVEAAAIAAVTTFALSLQYVASGRFGIPGVGINNDLAPHLYWILHLIEHGSVPPDVAGTGYPTAPHAVIATLLRVVGAAGVEQAFVAFMLAGAVVTAIAASTVLARAAWPLRIGGAAFVPFTYLSAAYFAQGAYKEALAGSLVVGCAIAASTDGTPNPVSVRARAASVVAIMFAMYGAVGVSGLAWPIGIAALLALVAVGRRVRRPALNRRLIVGVLGMIVLLAIVVALAFPRLQTQVQLLRSLPEQSGNVIQHLPLLEVFGVWDSHDFRALPPDALRAGLLAGWAALLALFALGWWIRRRELGVPAAVIVSLGMWVVGRQVQGPYWVAKLLAVAAPAVMLLTLRPILELATVRVRRAPAAALLTALGVIFVILATMSTARVLTSAPVSSMARTDELAPVRAEIGTEDVFYLGQDYFINVRLRSTHVSHFYPYSMTNPIQLDANPTKPVIIGSLFDFDSPTAETLDRFAWVLTARGSYRSDPPPNWKSVTRTTSYELFRRNGPTPPRITFDGANDFAATPTCGSSDVLPEGSVSLRAAPVRLRPQAWLLDSGDAPTVYVSNVTLGPLQQISQDVRLEPGTWELVMQYQSPVRLRIGAGSRRFVLPPDPDVMGNRWRVGEFDVASAGPTRISIGVEEPAIPRGAKGVVLGEVALVRTSSGRQVSSDRATCDDLVDWVRPSEA